MVGFRIQPLGDGAVTAFLSDSLDAHVIRRVWSANNAIRDTLKESALDIVTAYTSVTVRFDPHTTSLAVMMATVRGALERASAQTPPEGRKLEIGVCFNREVALDLESAAHELQLTEQQLVQAFCAAEYEVAFLGFTAGFPYLLGLPPKLSLPRLATPRTRVPAGSVAIAGGQCGIYPRSTPGGWRVLGQTRATLFTPERHPPTLLRPADRVRFRLVTTIDEAQANFA